MELADLELVRDMSRTSLRLVRDLPRTGLRLASSADMIALVFINANFRSLHA